MQLNELFKSDTDFKVDGNAASWLANGTLKNNDTISVMCYKNMPSLNMWSIEFAVDDDFDLTGKGNEFEVFAHVTAMLKAFFKDKSPDQVYMSAEEKNRADLYHKMMRRLLKGWKIVTYFDMGNDCYVLAAVKGTQFNVVTTGRGTGVQITTHSFLGYRDGEETGDLEEAEGLGDQLKTELAKAEELSMGEE